ncbi:MAG: DUF4342 domain-containing protein [Chloroflexi bacterium]|nr:DUF4342 domain-containing protein [Chloroflexota bacterium]
MSDNQITPPENNNGGNKHTFNEELEVAGNQLVERVKELIEQGNVRRLIIRNPEGRTLMEIPLTLGAVAGGALLFFYPVLAGLAAIGALVARLKIEIVREEPDALVQDAKKKIEDVKNDLEG